MHRLRKDGRPHRGLRQGILIAAALGAITACAPRTGAAGGTAAWFQIRSGLFQPVRGPDAALSVAARPWTVQYRVADMAFLGDTLYAAVNGFGLAEIAMGPAGTASFTYHTDPLIFAHRTVTTLVPRQGILAVHLYYNGLLNDAAREELAIAGISLVSWLPGQSDFAFLVPPFQRKNPDWEAAGFAPESENSFEIEWKYSDSTETRFAYTRYHADTKAEETVTRDTFMAALGVPSVSGPSVPADLAAFFAACQAGMGALPPGASVQFSLRSKESPVRRNYRSLPESDAAVTVPVFETRGARLALLPGGRLLTASPGETPLTVRLPTLPAGCRYTDLVALGDYLVVPWEETSFTDVGRAGILLLRQR